MSPSMSFYQAIGLASNCDWDRLLDLLRDHPEIAHETDGDRYLIVELAGHSGSAQAIEYLAASGVNLDLRTNEGETAIGRAISRDSTLNNTLPNLSVLLRCGANPNQITTSGNTPLLFAVEMNKPAHFELLVSSGGDPSLPSNDLFPMTAVDLCNRPTNRVFGEILKAADLQRAEGQG